MVKKNVQNVGKLN